MESYKSLHRQINKKFEENQSIDSDRVFNKNDNEFIIKRFDLDMLSISASEHTKDCIRIGVLDTETTGTNLDTDEVVELAITILDYYTDLSSHIYIDTISWLRHTDVPMNNIAKTLTGIKQEELINMDFPVDDILSCMDKCDYIISHKVSFDYPMLKKIFGNKLDNYNWRCSLEDIPWETFIGNSSRSLYSLALEHGVHYNGHRASVDTQILSYVLTRNCGNGGTYLDILIEDIETKRLLCVSNPPYSCRKVINEAGLNRWYPPLRCWWNIINVDSIINIKKVLLDENLDVTEINLNNSERFLTPVDLFSKLDI
eukprot:TRINITY_DN9585_c0_g1_i2.p1 TRINITY_DN9585_c0_g1~~TRINITY_DN9585_c0_g1_i2.p1  ORF type:complete len:314 (-),score=30.53 TRINITY_DN9585_c0_g1_i2:120-1061(-)